ncbi:calpastatin, isoform CRA_c [Rattus norvegicus]|uniref:Calpastatin n=1 Tax=Rattus norvegicus TaxID=10116 RepID=A6I4E6_RAT|nr:calpastatin, isoform CRA_c [Rattus norvegicus]
MGQFLSTTFWEGSPTAVWHEKLHEGEHKGAGETISVFQDHVICLEEREHGSKHHEAKAKEERQEKCGEDEDTVPAEYRLKPAKDKDGKPLLPEPEETSKCLSESELIGELSADFVQPTYQEKPSMPAAKIKKSKDTSQTPMVEIVPFISMCSMPSAPPKLA